MLLYLIEIFTKHTLLYLLIISIFSVLKDQDSRGVDYDVDVQGGFDETGARNRVLNHPNNYRFQQQRYQQQTVGYGKAALAHPLQAGAIQSPFNNYPGIHQNYHPNPNIVNNNGQYFIQPQQPDPHPLYNRRRGL